jgi:hypothetical protein
MRVNEPEERSGRVKAEDAQQKHREREEGAESTEDVSILQTLNVEPAVLPPQGKRKPESKERMDCGVEQEMCVDSTDQEGAGLRHPRTGKW